MKFSKNGCNRGDGKLLLKMGGKAGMVGGGGGGGSFIIGGGTGNFLSLFT